MAKLSSTDVALEGFRITRERPGLLLAWAILAFVFALISGGLLVGMAGGALMQFRDLSAAGASAQPDPKVMLALMGRLAPAYGLVLLLSLIYYAVLYAAGDRAVLRPGERSFGYLRLGGQELMQFLVFVLLGLLFFAVYLVSLIIAGVVIALAGLAPRPVGALVAVIVILGVICLMVWLFVRLSLTSAATFDTGRIGLGLSWRLTKGRFWPLFGAYFLAFVLLLVIGILTLVILVAIAALIGGGLTAVGGLIRPDMSSFVAYYTPVMIVQLVLSAFVSALAMAVTICAPALAYRELRGEAPAGVAGGGTSV